MKRKWNVDQLSLLERRPSWRNLPDDVRRRVCELLARCLSDKLRVTFASSNEKEKHHASR
jgi:hypothetical protein